MTATLVAGLACAVAAVVALVEGAQWHVFAQFAAIEFGLIAFALALVYLARGG